MYSGICTLIKLRDRPPSDRQQYTQFIQDILEKLKEIMNMLILEKSEFERKTEGAVAGMREEHERVVNEKDQRIKQLNEELVKKQQEIQKLEWRLVEELGAKEQSIQVLKGILKKKILNQVVKDRQYPNLTLRKTVLRTFCDRKSTRSKVDTLLKQVRSLPRFSERSPGKQHSTQKRKSEQTTTASSRISSFYGSLMRIGSLSSNHMFREDFI